MKKLLFVLLLIPLVSFGQSQMLNGIEVNAPLGFKKTIECMANESLSKAGF